VSGGAPLGKRFGPPGASGSAKPKAPSISGPKFPQGGAKVHKKGQLQGLGARLHVKDATKGVLSTEKKKKKKKKPLGQQQGLGSGLGSAQDQQILEGMLSLPKRPLPYQQEQAGAYPRGATRSATPPE